MRKALVLAAIVSIVAIPMGVGNIGFCRGMPCCPPHVGTQMADAHQPDCCNTANCAQTPTAGREYTKQADHHAPVLVAVATLPAVQTFAFKPDPSRDATTSIEPRTVHRRIALLSFLLI